MAGPDDTRVNYSNYGLELDIMAPGGNMSVDLDGNGYGNGILQETYYLNPAILISYPRIERHSAHEDTYFA
jgi:hypothetical protein